MKYTTKLKVVDAEQLLWERWSWICETFKKEFKANKMRGLSTKEADAIFFTESLDPDSQDIFLLLEGKLVMQGEWIIRDSSGELSSLSDKKFKEKYNWSEPSPSGLKQLPNGSFKSTRPCFTPIGDPPQGGSRI